MARKKRSAAEYIDELANTVYDFLVERRDHLNMALPPLTGEVRSYLGSISGRPTSMTDVVLRALVNQGRVTLEPTGGDSLVIINEEKTHVS